MMVKFSELRKGDLIKASWLGSYRGSEWHEVLDVNPSYSDSRKVRVNIEGYGSIDRDKNDTIERQ